MSLTLPPLPYALDALEPYISRATLAAHHGHHHAAYIEKTRFLTQRTPLESAALEEIVLASASQNTALFNAAAQAWNHEFYWNSLRPGGGGEATGTACARAEAAKRAAP
jgi:Fe-Mn family superoxide dismutase